MANKISGVLTAVFMLTAFRVGLAADADPANAPSQPASAAQAAAAAAPVTPAPAAAPAAASDAAQAARAPAAQPAASAVPAGAAAPAAPSAAATSGISPAREKQLLAAGYRPEHGSDGETRYCRRETQLGSRFDRKICKTESQIAQQERDSKDFLAEKQQTSGNPAGH